MVAYFSCEFMAIRAKKPANQKMLECRSIFALQLVAIYRPQS
jgi:hypothetical protein